MSSVPRDYKKSERFLTYVMRIYAPLFGIVGFVFLLFPWFTLNNIDKLAENPFTVWIMAENPLFQWLDLKFARGITNAQGSPAEYFWVFLSFSMMITIATCSYIASKDIKKNRAVIIPIIFSMLVASSSGLAFYLVDGYFSHLVVFLAYFPLFLFTLYLFKKASPEKADPSRPAKEDHVPSIPHDYMKSERSLTYVLRIYAPLFGIVGFVFLLFPWFTLHNIDELSKQSFIKWIMAENPLFKWLNWGFALGKTNAQGSPAEYFWVFLSFSMMITIATCSYIAYEDIRKNRSVIIPIIFSKLASSSSGLAFYLVDGYFSHLVVFLADFPLFLLTLYLFKKAHTGRIPEAYQSSNIEPGDYKEMCIDEKKTRVACIHNDDKYEALEQVLKETEFFEIVAKKWKDSGKDKEDFLIAVKANFMMTYNRADKSTFTDPGLVEYLLEKLRLQGYSNLCVVESRNTYGVYFEKRGVEEMAEYLGYEPDFYTICDLTEEMEDHDYGGPLGPHPVGKTWRDADFRVSFAKNKTHSFSYYTLTLKNIYGTLPLENKLLEYHKRREIAWPTIETLKHFPVHFGLVDAFLSADGPMGVISDLKPNETRAIIGGEKLVAVDWVGALKMSLDPLKSRFMQIAVSEFGNPEEKIDFIGDDTPYSPWKNVRPFIVDTLALAEESWRFSHSFMSTFIFAERYFPRKPTSLVSKILRFFVSPFMRLFFKTGHRLRRSERI